MKQLAVITILLGLLFIACKDQKHSDDHFNIVPNYVGREFNPNVDSILILTKGNGDDRTFNLTGWTIVTQINGDCGSCVGELSQWDSLITEYSKIGNLNFYTFVTTKDIDRFSYLFRNDLNFSHPIYYDKSGMISNLFPQEYSLQTFLINEDRIVVVGNPLFNKPLSKLYLKHLTSATK